MTSHLRKSLPPGDDAEAWVTLSVPSPASSPWANQGISGRSGSVTVKNFFRSSIVSLALKLVEGSSALRSR